MAAHQRFTVDVRLFVEYTPPDFLAMHGTALRRLNANSYSILTNFEYFEVNAQIGQDDTLAYFAGEYQHFQIPFRGEGEYGNTLWHTSPLAIRLPLHPLCLQAIPGGGKVALVASSRVRTRPRF